MKSKLPFILLLTAPFLSFSQTGFPAQVSLPVFYKPDDPGKQKATYGQIGEMCGIGILLLNDQTGDDYLLVSGQGNSILFFESVGVSAKETFILSDQDSLSRFELISSNNTVNVGFFQGETQMATGTLVKEKGQYLIKLSGNEKGIPDLQQAILQVNDFLLRLHENDQKRIEIKPGFNPDTLNAICGHDTQFDTNFEIIWLESGFYTRLAEAARAAHAQMKMDNTPFQKKIENRALVEHIARLNLEGVISYGTLHLQFKVEGENNYFFLKGGKPYQLIVDYIYRETAAGKPVFQISQMSIRNSTSGDFVELHIIDLLPKGLPVLYVDLINSVIMEEYGTWNIMQVFAVFEDVFHLVKLPNEQE